MTYIILSVVADFSTFEASRSFIDAFERQLAPFTIVSCEWSRYPKFEHSYWYDWYLKTDERSAEARQQIRGLFGPGWDELPNEEAIWNRAEELDPASQPVRWVHLHGTDLATTEVVQKRSRGPKFVKSRGPFISVSQSGEITGVYGDRTDAD